MEINCMKLQYISVALSLVLSASTHANENSIPYPEGYRNWYHVKSMIIQQGHPLAEDNLGIHHIYANTEALKGYKTGEYPDGAVLVFDLLEDIEKDKTIQEGSRKLIAVMYKDSKFFTKTGGWGYEGFAGDSKTERLVKDKGVSCHSCHLSKQSEGYVFSTLRK